MNASTKKITRCAIYTRKSTERGLELEFNSLQAQREACEAYIKSQAIEGWRALHKQYDDPAYSGGSLERPALQQLLEDIASGQIDVVIVYKIDRLTRSLTDFAKLVERFEAKSVSFVAVTQQFNSHTSMGRLTLNVLLSFAQFERELASERVRDKVAVSRRKGKWTGGSIPLGYDIRDKKLVINPKEAKTVRYIFHSYLKLQNFRSVVADLDTKKITTKRRVVATGKIIGGARFTYGPLAYLLKNRTYLAETSHGGKWFPGEHQPIVDGKLFKQVQEQLRRHGIARRKERSAQEALLTSILFDDHGNRMSPSFTTKKGVRYRFYVSTALLQGRSSEAGSVVRVSGTRIEKAIIDELVKRKILQSTNTSHSLLLEVVESVIVSESAIEILLKCNHSRKNARLKVPWLSKSSDPCKIQEPTSKNGKNDLLIHSIVRAHQWLKLLKNGKHKSIESLATEIKFHPKVIREMIQLAFLSPEIVSQILTGSQPALLNLKTLKRCRHLSWSRQSDEMSKFLVS